MFHSLRKILRHRPFPQHALQLMFGYKGHGYSDGVFKSYFNKPLFNNLLGCYSGLITVRHALDVICNRALYIKEITSFSGPINLEHTL